MLFFLSCIYIYPFIVRSSSISDLLVIVLILFLNDSTHPFFYSNLLSVTSSSPVPRSGTAFKFLCHLFIFSRMMGPLLLSFAWNTDTTFSVHRMIYIT
ncbi:hypothetical protein F5050DRAFT_769454 [Lentinula boryana]|uniref:Uncharacterized protein n=1 Tax=Lentinula boryana TaxID=40481 RepID=A0ABQ8Q3Q3_9AGAR|nr:hypothetical protein F5050DRAFT_769454 [Lentinula boryana]